MFSTFDFSMPDFSNAKHIGDTENHKVLHYEYNGTNVYCFAASTGNIKLVNCTNDTVSLNNNIIGTGYYRTDVDAVNGRLCVYGNTFTITYLATVPIKIIQISTLT